MKTELRTELKINHLISNDIDDCRGMVFVLIENGYIVWLEKIFDAATKKANQVICYTHQDRPLAEMRPEQLSQKTIPFRLQERVVFDTEVFDGSKNLSVEKDVDEKKDE